MPGWMLLAALASQISFHASQQGTAYILRPEVVVARNCRCAVMLEVIRHGQGGEFHSRQQRQLLLYAQRPQTLAQLRLTLEAHDDARVIVTVSDGESINIINEWRPTRPDGSAPARDKL